MPDHHPPHYCMDETWYFISASTYQRLPFLRSHEAKIIFRDQLGQLAKSYRFKLAAWVILNNHYHLLFMIKNSAKITEIFRKLHGRVSHDINVLENVHHRKIWHNYWDTCITSEREWYMCFNYIHQNPVKHGYVTETTNWIYSSYPYYIRTKGEEWLMDALLNYPINSYQSERDNY